MAGLEKLARGSDGARLEALAGESLERERQEPLCRFSRAQCKHRLRHTLGLCKSLLLSTAVATMQSAIKAQIYSIGRGLVCECPIQALLEQLLAKAFGSCAQLCPHGFDLGGARLYKVCLAWTLRNSCSGDIGFAEFTLPHGHLLSHVPARLMFSLLYGFWEYIFRKEEFRILVVGIDKAGKTTLLEKLKSLYSGVAGLDPDKILPTVGLNVGRVEAHNSLLVFWDLGGQAGLRPIWDKYYSDSHGLIFTVDSSQPERFAEAKDALERALGSRDLFGAPILVLANKQVRPDDCYVHGEWEERKAYNRLPHQLDQPNGTQLS